MRTFGKAQTRRALSIGEKLSHIVATAQYEGLVLDENSTDADARERIISATQAVAEDPTTSAADRDQLTSALEKFRRGQPDALANLWGKALAFL